MLASLLSHIAIAQIHTRVGDFAGNARAIVQAIEQAKKQGAHLLITPELALTGYPPEDLILHPEFLRAQTQALHELAQHTRGGISLLVGAVEVENGQAYNAAFFMHDGRIAQIFSKCALPNEGVFDEKRIFSQGAQPGVFEWKGVRIGVLICEDVWDEKIVQSLSRQHPDGVIVLNASPFEDEKFAARLQVTKVAATACNAPLLYVNRAGAQDDLVFDGASFLMTSQGKVERQFPWFIHGVFPLATALDCAAPGIDEQRYRAICEGLRCYVEDQGFSGVVLGISGGVDSALVAAMAVDALGASRVLGVLLPSPFTSPASVDDALALAKNLGMETITLPITPLMDSARAAVDAAILQPNWMELPHIGGNLQARLRMLLLMALSNARGLLLLSTSNKSESAVGYTTLYGDMSGGFAPIKDLFKMQVYALAKWRNELSASAPPIPANTLLRAPSAELKPNQTDQDQLPDYETLDAILQQLIVARASVQEVIAQGFSAHIVQQVAQLLKQSEYKRRQAPIGPKISSVHFGRDRRIPLSSGFNY